MPRTHPANRIRVECCRIAVAGFALGLVMLLAARAPAGPLTTSYQHTVHYQGQRANQPCFDFSVFDGTVPRAGFLPVLQPDCSRQTVRLAPVPHTSRCSEFRLYNRPPPLS